MTGARYFVDEMTFVLEQNAMLYFLYKYRSLKQQYICRHISLLDTISLILNAVALKTINQICMLNGI